MTRRWPIPRLAFSRRRAEAQSGADNNQFHTVILPHLDAAWNYARYLTRDADSAEDVVQEAFLRAWRAQAGCKGDGKAWLLAIVRNCWHDWRRPVPNGIAPATEAVDDETPHTLLERQSDAAHLRSALAALPEPFRETLVLREMEELTYREIAEIIDAPIGTVMSRLARGRDLLATLVKGELNQ